MNGCWWSKLTAIINQQLVNIGLAPVSRKDQLRVVVRCLPAWRNNAATKLAQLGVLESRQLLSPLFLLRLALLLYSRLACPADVIQ
jgi:hypothetical protein